MLLEKLIEREEKKRISQRKIDETNTFSLLVFSYLILNGMGDKRKDEFDTSYSIK